MNIANVRTGLYNNITAVIPVTDYQISSYMLASPNPPAIDMFPEKTTYTRAMGTNSLTELMFCVRAVVGYTTDRSAQIKLDDLLETGTSTSIKDAIERDKTLGGAVGSLMVIDSTGYRVYNPHSPSPVLGCEWTVKIFAA